jgi:hypothetical protein
LECRTLVRGARNVPANGLAWNRLQKSERTQGNSESAKNPMRNTLHRMDFKHTVQILSMRRYDLANRRYDVPGTSGSLPLIAFVFTSYSMAKARLPLFVRVTRNISSCHRRFTIDALRVAVVSAWMAISCVPKSKMKLPDNINELKFNVHRVYQIRFQFPNTLKANIETAP